MELAIIALTKSGINIAHKIEARMGGDIYITERFFDQSDSGKVHPIKTPFIDFVHRIFPKYTGLIFVTATGIAVRAIANVIKDKRTDPAVVVVDEQGKSAISLLSGHLGGANELALKIARVLGCTPVITTASDIQGFESIDLLAKRLGLYIDNFSDLARVSSCIVNGEKVALSVERGFPQEKLVGLSDKTQGFSGGVPRDAAATVFVTDEKISPPTEPYAILRPQNTVLGIGARRGASYQELLSLLEKALEDFNLSEQSVGCISSIEIKKDEECICRLAEYLNVPLKLYTKAQLSKYEDLFPKSPFVKTAVGVGCVARPSAYIASLGGKELGYYKGRGITLSVFKRRTS